MNERKFKKDVSRMALCALGVAFFQTIASVLYVLNPSWNHHVMVLVQTAAGCLPVILIASKTWRTRPSKFQLHTSLYTFIQELAMLIVLGTAAAACWNQVLVHWLPDAAGPDLSMQTSVSYNLSLIISAVFLGPLLEEMLFRGLLLPQAARYDRRFAICFTSELFALAHFNAAQMVPAFCVGLFLGHIYLKQDSLGLVILLHMGYNGYGFLVSAFQLPIIQAAAWLILILGILGWIHWLMHHSIQPRRVPYWGKAHQRPAVWVLILLAAVSIVFA
ncbi:CPBP family intramembrane glutamic endopeptidase [Catenisphaera adipataccumulans]|jgi:membrane protease YdiL (CAAX protease family)|uniref:Membrane protease YdiL (CAAX protease family) n=1 Tax=Catenisphaera adipataccumulans TaxID=700500 RepID=A0A7W8CXK9_9FIRM|nr:CPBP family intramembrane glutamic endopeptidase [Catenisphaera adipataccumulans]MBB5183495.1 membrane protease YdiL (CAAX protease family) [Catenisphaera adipataccumulans]